MTLGQRIQELRRARGLSQEGLGDLLGVSRQAISKWESDITIPEVDKLVAISRWFEVSVGFLLGVEENQPQPERQTQRELTERELALVETIVNRYLEQREQLQPEPEPRPKRWKWAAAVLAGLLVVAWFTVSDLNDRIDQLKDQTQIVQNQVSGVEWTVTNQVNGLASRLERLLEAQNHLLSQWECVLVDYIPGQKGVFSMSARPKEYIPGMTAVFCAENDKGETVSAPAQWDGVSYAARLEVPLWDAPKFSIELDDGQSRKTQPMEAKEVYMLQSHFGIFVPSAGRMGNHTLTRDGELILDMEIDVELEARTPGDFNRELLRPARLTLVMTYGKQELLRRELDVEQKWVAIEGAGRWRADVSGTYPVQGEDKLEVELLVTDNFGRRSNWVITSENIRYE